MALGVIVGGRLGYDLFYGTFFCGLWSGRDCGDLPMGYLTDPLRHHWPNGTASYPSCAACRSMAA